MSRSLALALAVCSWIACGPPKPAVTVPAPPVTSTETAVAPPPAPDGLAPPQPTLRLPRNFLPTAYTARLAIDPSKDRFSGAIEIAGTVAEKSSVIWLHGYHLTIAKATAAQGTTQVALAVTAKGEDLLEIRAAQPLDAGAWTLAFEYTGELDPVNTTGAFKQTVAGEHYVFSQLEALYARRVFPCFDEPNVKTPWKLTLDVPKALTAVANTTVASETALDASTKRVDFAPTKPLPSYLVAFGVGPFEIIDGGRTKHGTPVRIVTLAKRGPEAAYAASTTAKLLETTEDYFGTPYPYDKLDMMTIPITVGFGAMENAGLITFTERLMLMDPKKAAKSHQWIWNIVAAHEIAHQWFGDLVTPEFWDDIWLNEGFASWLAYKTNAKLDPGDRDTESPIGTRNGALQADALVSARKVRQPIESVGDIQTAFDGISYDKGASVLYMFENYVGADVFQRGVRDYIASRAFGNATSTDFVTAIAKASGKPVDAAFATFLEQAGAPEITATPSCTGGKVEVALTQRRYLPPGAPEPAAGTPWIVPMCLAYDKAGKRAETCALLDKVSTTVPLDTKTCPRWVMPNATGRGYYRNAYTVQQVTALRDEAWAKLSWAERRVLFFDVTSAASNGKLPLQLALSFTPKLLAGNDRFTVPPPVGFAIGFNELVPDDLRPKYEYWLRQQFGAAATAVGFLPKDTDTYDIEEMRGSLLHTVAWTSREPTLVAEAVKLAEKWRELPESVRGTVLTIAADARPEVFDKLVKEVAAEPERAKRGEMIDAIGAVRDPARFKTALGLTLDPKLDVREVLFMVFEASTEATREVAKQFVRDNKDAILARIPNAQTTAPLARYARVFTATCKADQRDAIVDYVTKTFTSMPGGERTVKQAIEAMDQCIARRKLVDPELRAWLGGIKLPKK